MGSAPNNRSIRQTLALATATIAKTPSTTPRLDAEIIVGSVLARSRTDLLVHDDDPIEPDSSSAIERLVEQRCSGWPIAYLTGQKGFREFDLSVGPGVLVPRPETETLVDLVTQWSGNRQWPDRPVIVDVGTGSGAIALSLAATLAHFNPFILASDVSLQAIRYASMNLKRHPHRSVQLVHGDLLTWLGQPVDIVVANLPYLRPDQVSGNWELAIEPVTSLVAGDDGLTLVSRLLDQATTRVRGGGLLALELDPGNILEAGRLAAERFPTAWIRIESDLAGQNRFLLLELPVG